jgi:hypothetical protein
MLIVEYRIRVLRNVCGNFDRRNWGINPDPGPRDCETSKGKADQCGSVMAFRQRMSKLGGRKSKRNHESQVEQKFEWSRDAVKLVWIAPAHPPGVMMQGVGTGRHRVHSCAICRIILRVSSRGRGLRRFAFARYDTKNVTTDDFYPIETAPHPHPYSPDRDRCANSIFGRLET